MNLIPAFERDLHKLIEEINLYKNENDLWKTKENIRNPAGNLALHLIGNLNYFIGNILGNSGYPRDREKEFSLKNIPREKLIAGLNDVIAVISGTLSKLSNEDLKKDFPVKIADKVLSTENALIHLLSHLNYHLGQINYHRRMI